jgi:HAD superfamily hydrolase (TIGR01509 family)
VATALLDIDGTLVDTNYQHALAWFRAFDRHGILLPIWRIHRHIGMGGDQLVGALTDEQTERESGDAIRAAEGELYMEMIGEVRAMAGSRELLLELRERGHTVVLASSAKPHEVDHYLYLLDARELAACWTTAGDVEATKPHPDLIEHSLERSGSAAADSVMVGDSTWDVEAAARAGVGSVAVMTGGFAREELRQAGADAVFESVGELCERLAQTQLR